MKANPILLLLLVFSALACLSIFIWPLFLILSLHLFDNLSSNETLTGLLLTFFMLSYPITVSIGFIVCLEAYRQGILKNALWGLSISWAHLVVLVTLMNVVDITDRVA